MNTIIIAYLASQIGQKVSTKALTSASCEEPCALICVRNKCCSNRTAGHAGMSTALNEMRARHARVSIAKRLRSFATYVNIIERVSSVLF